MCARKGHSEAEVYQSTQDLDWKSVPTDLKSLVQIIVNMYRGGQNRGSVYSHL